MQKIIYSLLIMLLFGMAPNTALAQTDSVAFSGYVATPSGLYMRSDRGLYNYSANGRTPVATGMDFFLAYQSSLYFGGGTFFDNKYAFSAVYFDNSKAYNWVSTYCVYDFATGKLTKNDLSTVDYTRYASDVTYDPVTENVYGSFYSADRSKAYFGTRDKETGATTLIAEIPAMYTRIAADFDGQLWGLDSAMNLIKIDKTNGASTIVGPTGITSSEIGSAVFDLNTGKLYVTNSNGNNGESALYEINLETGKGTKQFDIYGRDQVMGIWMPMPAAKKKAPGYVQDLTPDFGNQGSLTGNVSFTLPSKTFDGETDLTGNLKAVVSLNKSQNDTLVATAGSKVTHNVTVPSPGEYSISVHAFNDGGKGPSVDTTLWIGDDAPKAVENLSLKRQGTTAQLSWSKPTETEHGGYLNEGALRYTIVRKLAHSQDTVATNIAETEWQEDVKATSPVRYQYSVIPSVGQQKGDETLSNTVNFGPAYSAPAAFNFDKESDIDEFSVYDVNEDKETWENGIYAGRFSQNVRCNTSNVQANDWIISPDVNLEAGKIYKIGFSARGSYSYTRAEHVEAFIGQGSSPASMQTTILADTALTNDMQRFDVYFKPEISGTYNIGIHATSPYKANTNGFYIYADSLTVSSGMNGGEPNFVTDLEGKGGDKGALNVTLTMKAPTLTFDDKALTSSVVIEVLNDKGMLQKIQGGFTPGEAVTFTDIKAQQGMNTYRVIASNSVGRGEAKEIQVYAGVGLPQEPRDVSLDFDESGQPLLTWKSTPDVSSDGYYVDTTKIKYIIAKQTIVDGNIQYIRVDSVDSGVNSWTDPNEYTGAQESLIYAIVGSNAAGIGYGALSNLVITGDSYTLPFSENVSENSDYRWINFESNPDYRTQWGATNAYTAENDGTGSFLFNTSSRTQYRGYSPDSCTLVSGKISLKNSVEPSLSYKVAGYPNSNVKLYVMVSRNGNPKNLEIVDSVDLNTNTEAAFQQRTVSLEKYAGLDGILLGFKVVAVKDPVILDDIEVTGKEKAGIKEVGVADDSVDTYYYDLSGRRVINPSGIVIKVKKYSDGRTEATKTIK